MGGRQCILLHNNELEHRSLKWFPDAYDFFFFDYPTAYGVPGSEIRSEL